MEMLSVKEAIILAGGLGTRLQYVLNNLPKPMADVNGRPFLAYLLDYLASQNISRVILSVGYRNEVISDYFKNEYKGIRIEYAVESEPLGTGGAILNALQLVTADDVFVLNGDTYFPIPLDDMMQFHQSRKGMLSIALKNVNDVSRYGSIYHDAKGCVTGIAEKGRAGAGTINAGIYLINVSEIKRLEIPEKFSLEKDVMERMYRENRFFGKSYDAYFIDIGIPRDYYRLISYFVNGAIGTTP